MLGSSAVHLRTIKIFTSKNTLTSDMGLEHYAIMSNEEKVPNPRHLINACRNLRRKQKRYPASANRKRPESVWQTYTNG